ncbi:hypothetical protein SD70_25160 [Gordoniibacillus kamchatkensis]|uniref:Uncharacterized protein n=1 Tax=Gordoniibacillus kamchatkensis TaxID=1590651 RepID=A0ABR5ACA1_9BACL|nr:hypothetical protein [Paenibacillus sp. VKM B-2647]KIL38659.1 hypothetical protein SD70_25160 [Paenibacillus sp. VKM B-2647]
MNFIFDKNEWFVVVASIVLMSYIVMIRKHFRPATLIILWVYNIAFIATIDYAIAATPFHVYDCLDNETYEPMAAYAHAFVYTPYSIIFLYYYDKWGIRGKKLIWYLAAWTCYALCFEWISLKFGFLTYRTWRLYYSIPTYPIAALILICAYRFIEKSLAGHPFRSGE